MERALLLTIATLGIALVACVEESPAHDAGLRTDSGADGGVDDADLEDAGLEDAGLVDASLRDAGDLDASSDAGGDASIDGVTCVVEEREPGCLAGTPVTYEDVPFEFQYHTDHVVFLTSPLAAFADFYNSVDPPAFPPTDPAGSSYAVGDPNELPDELTRLGLVLDVDIDVARQGSSCLETPGAPPLIRIRCTGRTLLPPPYCEFVRPALDPAAPSLSCTVSRRDATCTPIATTTELPRFWLMPGAHGPESEIRTDSAALIEALESTGDLVFYQEAPCSSYATDVRNPRHLLMRDGMRVGTNLEIVGAETCRDSLGRSQPVLRVSCEGATTLVPR